jgi:hypothetical protein
MTIALQTLGPLWLLVPAKTGITYEHQYAGTACEQVSVEGFLVPVSVQNIQTDTDLDFWSIVHAIPQMQVYFGEGSSALELDKHSLREDDDEAFIPVKCSPWGKCWLIWENSD